METNPRIVIWRKWVNPLTGNGEDDAISETKDDPFKSEYKDSYQEHEESRIRHFTGGFYDPKIGPCLVGPLGIIPMMEHGDPSKVYDFWMMDTNFKIDQYVQETGSNVDGVESWNTFSPYRARISFGRAFERKKVMSEIQKALGAVPAKRDEDGNIVFSKPKEEKRIVNHKDLALEIMKSNLAKKHKFWAIFVSEKGNLDVVAGEEGDVKKAIADKPNHKAITSWENSCQK